MRAKPYEPLFVELLGGNQVVSMCMKSYIAVVSVGILAMRSKLLTYAYGKLAVSRIDQRPKSSQQISCSMSAAGLLSTSFSLQYFSCLLGLTK